MDVFSAVVAASPTSTSSDPEDVFAVTMHRREMSVRHDIAEHFSKLGLGRTFLDVRPFHRFADALFQHRNHALLQRLGECRAEHAEVALWFDVEGMFKYIHVMFVQDHP